LRRRGVKLDLDDFGCGYNSFDMIKKLRIDGLKIDGTVTRDILPDAVDLALVNAALPASLRFGVDRRRCGE
jgi:EAL domain-containing protein (putative c-di-GMP-specific phosphodiesterase class I)